MIKVTSENGHVELECEGKTTHILIADFGCIVREFAIALLENGIEFVPDRIKHITEVALDQLEEVINARKDE